MNVGSGWACLLGMVKSKEQELHIEKMEVPILGIMWGANYLNHRRKGRKEIAAFENAGMDYV